MRTVHSQFAAALAACPLVAILRGLRPDEAQPIGAALVARASGLKLFPAEMIPPPP